MKIPPATLFFIIFVITILVTRTFLYVNPTPSPTIKDIRLHHYMYGIVLIPIGLVVSSISIFAVGTGLFIDELTYLIIGGKTHEDNYSKVSLIGTGLLIIGVFFLRKYLVMPFG